MTAAFSPSALCPEPLPSPVCRSQGGATEPRLKLGILGAGRWGSHLIRNFGAAARAEVIAIADPQADCLQRSQGLLAEQPLLLGDWRSLLATPGLEALVVATPAQSHYAVIEAALQRGLHVLAEKPLCLSSAECDALCRLAQQQQRQLVVDHTYLFHPAVAAGRELVRSGALGQLRYGYASRTHLGPVRQDVDALWDLAIHDIAIFNHWLGLVPRWVQGQGQVWLQPELDLPLSPGGPADLVWAQLRYGGPGRAGEAIGSSAQCLSVQLHLAWLNPDKQRKLVLVGERAALIFDELAPEPLVLMRGRLAPGQLDRGGWQPLDQARLVVDYPPQEPLQQLCEHFLDCAIANQPSPCSSGEVGAALVSVLEALSQSLRSGAAVTLSAAENK